MLLFQEVFFFCFLSSSSLLLSKQRT